MKIKQTSESELKIVVSAWPSRLGGLVLTVPALAYLARPEEFKKLPTEYMNYVIGTAFVLALVGIGMFFLKSSTRVTLRKSADSEIARRKLLGTWHKRVFSTKDVKEVRHISAGEQVKTNNGVVTNSSSSIDLIMNSSGAVKIVDQQNIMSRFGMSKTGGGVTQNRPLAGEAQTISNFLGVQLKMQGNDVAPDLINSAGVAITNLLKPHETEMMSANELYERRSEQSIGSPIRDAERRSLGKTIQTPESKFTTTVVPPDEHQGSDDSQP